MQKGNKAWANIGLLFLKARQMNVFSDSELKDACTVLSALAAIPDICLSCLMLGRCSPMSGSPECEGYLPADEDGAEVERLLKEARKAS